MYEYESHGIIVWVWYLLSIHIDNSNYRTSLRELMPRYDIRWQEIPFPPWVLIISYGGENKETILVTLLMCWLYSALPISRGHFSPNTSGKTSPWSWIMPKFYLRCLCTVCNIVLYCTTVYQDSVTWTIYVFSWYPHFYMTEDKIHLSHNLCLFLVSSLLYAQWHMELYK